MAAKIKDSPVPMFGCGCGSQSSSIQSDWYINTNTGQWMYKGRPVGVSAVGRPGQPGEPGNPYIPNEETGTYWFEGEDTGIPIGENFSPETDEDIFI